MVVGRDTRLGRRVGDAWVVAALGIALELAATTSVHVASDVLVLRRGHATLAAYAIGAPWARELAATLDDRAEDVDAALGRITVGTAAAPAGRDDTPLGKLAPRDPQHAAAARARDPRRDRRARW